MSTIPVRVNKETVNSTLHVQCVPYITMPQPGSLTVCQTSQGSLQNGLSPVQKNGLTNNPMHMTKLSRQNKKEYVNMNNKIQ